MEFDEETTLLYDLFSHQREDKGFQARKKLAERGLGVLPPLLMGSIIHIQVAAEEGISPYPQLANSLSGTLIFGFMKPISDIFFAWELRAKDRKLLIQQILNSLSNIIDHESSTNMRVVAILAIGHLGHLALKDPEIIDLLKEKLIDYRDSETNLRTTSMFTLDHIESSLFFDKNGFLDPATHQRMELFAKPIFEGIITDEWPY